MIWEPRNTMLKLPLWIIISRHVVGLDRVVVCFDGAFIVR